MKTIQDAIAVYLELSVPDRTAFYITLSNFDGEPEPDHLRNEHSGIRVCPHCSSTHTVKNGRRKDGKQRFLCRNCGRSFLTTTSSLVSGTHKRLDVWRRYLTCMMEQKTLAVAAEECGISLGTSFHWRHKILDALKTTAGCVHLRGAVEADETYTPLSFKGNHTRSRHFTMPRPAHRRGKDHLPGGLSDQLVCIPCAVDRSGVPISGIGKTGKVSSDCLEQVFRNRLAPGTVLCTDHEKAYRHMSQVFQLEWIHTDTGRRTSGRYGIQRINAYHRKLKGFLRSRNGVATKYLANYLVWHDLMFCSVRERWEVLRQLWNTVLLEPFRENCRDLPRRPAVPQGGLSGIREVACV